MSAKTLKDTDLMPFGQYKGQSLGTVPDEYLLWLHGEMGKKHISPFALPLWNYLQKNIEAIKHNVDSQKPFFND